MNTPGFVDVSNMSDLEVKRLAQTDELDPRDNPYSYRNLANRNPYGYRKPMNKAPKIVINHNSDDVWAAAVQAQDVNGAYIKVSTTSQLDPKNNTESNRQIMERLLTDVSQITQESRDKGQEIRKYYQGFTFKILQGKPLNEFNNAAMTIANRDVINSTYDMAVIASLPSTYIKSTHRDSVDRRINYANGGFLGAVSQKIIAEIEVLKNVYSQNWNTWYVTGITDDNNVLFFAYRHDIKIGDRVKIQGVVKSHRDNSTQLNRVKVIK